MASERDASGEQANREVAPTDYVVEIQNILNTFPNLDELGVVLQGQVQDLPSSSVSPSGSFVVVNETKLAVVADCLEDLVRQCNSQFHALAARGVWHALPDRSVAQQCDALSLLVLMVNIDHTSAWNCRRRLVEHGYSPTAREFALLNLLFSKHPKTAQGWAYRRWLRARSPLLEGQAYEDERALCLRLVEYYPKNYYVWLYLAQISCSQPLSRVLREIEDMQEWMEAHMSDHCVVTYVQRLISTSQTELSGEKYLGLLGLQWGRVGHVLARFPRHESLWCHSRFVAGELVRHVLRKEDGGEKLSSTMEELCAAPFLYDGDDLHESGAWLSLWIAFEVAELQRLREEYAQPTSQQKIEATVERALQTLSCQAPGRLTALRARLANLLARTTDREGVRVTQGPGSQRV